MNPNINLTNIVDCTKLSPRTFSPYKWTTKVKLPEYNYKRVAAVWMDEYQELYYDRSVSQAYTNILRSQIQLTLTLINNVLI